MSRYVTDASVILKWYVPETFDEAARKYAPPAVEALVPDLAFAETGNAVWKKMRLGQIPRDRATELVTMLRKAPLQVYPSAPFLDRAFAVAADHDRAVYDCLYLALAESQGCEMVTADRKFYEAMQSTPYARRVRWVEEAP